MTCIVDTKKHRGDIINLWQSCFGDERDYISFFLDGCPHICIGEFSDNRLISMFFLLDGHIDKFKVKYLYAACTDKEYRGRGIMGRLIRYAEQWCTENKYDGIFLVPAEESLYSYYSRFGFTEGFYRQELSFKNTGADNCDLKKISAEEAAELRLNMLDKIDCFAFDEATNLYAVKEHIYCGGDIFCDCSQKNETLIFICNREKDIFIKEIISQNPVKMLKINTFFQKYSSENIYIRTPLVYNSTNIGVFGTKCGMCLSINPSLKDFISERKQLYAGMYLD